MTEIEHGIWGERSERRRGCCSSIESGQSAGAAGSSSSSVFFGAALAQTWRGSTGSLGAALAQQRCSLVQHWRSVVAAALASWCSVGAAVVFFGAALVHQWCRAGAAATGVWCWVGGGAPEPAASCRPLPVAQRRRRPLQRLACPGQPLAAFTAAAAASAAAAAAASAASVSGVASVHAAHGIALQLPLLHSLFLCRGVSRPLCRGVSRPPLPLPSDSGL